MSLRPAIFQRTIEGILKDSPKVIVYWVTLDDILLMGKNDQDHLNEFGLGLKRKNSKFMEMEVVFLGLKIDTMGIHLVPQRVQPMKEAPTPTSVTELKAYLGLLNCDSL